MPHVMLAGLSNEPAFTLARRLAALAPGNLARVFFSESGSVSVEVAMKIAVQYWANLGRAGRDRFICFEAGYHGDTFATMAVGDPDPRMHAPFAGALARHHKCAVPRTDEDFAAFDAFAARHAGTVAGIIIEPLVQGAGGMKFHPPETLAAIRATCDRHEILMIADEIMTGLGRTGTMFACDQAAIAPDIMTLSKSLTGGVLALAATLVTDEIFQAFQSARIEDCLMHGPTFTGNALACAAANASLDLFESEPRLEQIAAIEDHLSEALAPCRGLPGVTDVRVRGAIGVVEVADMGDVDWIRARFVDQGCWLRPFGNVVYLMPAYTISRENLGRLCDAVVSVMAEWSMRRDAA